MIERLGRPSAVLTTVTIAAKYGAAGNRGRSAIRDFHEPIEPDHRGDVDQRALRAPNFVLAHDDAGLLVQHEDDCPARGHHRKRFITGV